MIVYKTGLDEASLDGISSYTSRLIIEELRRIQTSSASVKKDLDAINRFDTVYIPLRTALVGASTANTMEPQDFGDVGMMLEVFGLINVDDIKKDGEIVELRLISSFSMNQTVPSGSGFVKLAIRLGGSSKTRLFSRETVAGTTVRKIFNELDLLPFVQEFINGNLFFGVGMWTGGLGLIEVGSSSSSKPNLRAGLFIKVKNP